MVIQNGCVDLSSCVAVQTATKLYLVLDFVNGGHLFFQLYRQGIFDEDLARLYTAEMVLAIAHLHSLGIAHRDLKPVRIHLFGRTSTFGVCPHAWTCRPGWAMFLCCWHTLIDGGVCQCL